MLKKTFYTNTAVYGNSILYRGVENGKRVRRRIDYRPNLFIASNASSSIRTINDEPLEMLSFNSIREAKEFVDRYKNNPSFPIYGITKYEYAIIADTFPNPIDWDIENIHVANIDIEVGPAPDGGFAPVDNPTGEVTAICLRSNDLYHVFGTKPYDNTDLDVEYHLCENEDDLLAKFLKLWASDYPDVVTGWHCKFFDFPYLVNRITLRLGEKAAKKLSPWEQIYQKTSSIIGKEQNYHEIVGVVILDYMELFRKFAPNGLAQESYKLDDIAFLEIGERKLSYEEYDSLFSLYEQDFQKFIKYNLRDCRLVDGIDAKLKLIDLAITAAYDAKANFDDVFQQTVMWTSIVYNHLRSKNIQILYIKENQKLRVYEGAYVKEPQLGAHKWVASFDLTSLYPSLILQFNISPETFKGMVPKPDMDKLLDMSENLSFLKRDDITLCPNGATFSRKKEGYLSEIIAGMFERRQVAKRRMIGYKKDLEKLNVEAAQSGLSEYLLLRKNEFTSLISRFDNIQSSTKVGLNSCYGALGSSFFFLFDIRLAEAITLAGQYAITLIQKRINAYMNTLLGTTDIDYVIASDTDSIYLCLDEIVKEVFKEGTPDTRKVIKFMNKVCEVKIQPFIDGVFEEFKEYTNSYSNKMIMKREVLCNKVIWTAGKHYMLNVYDNEGVEYAKPQLKIKGMNAIKSTTPAVCRGRLKEALSIIMDKDEGSLIDYIENFKEEFQYLPAEEIASPSGVNGTEKYADSTMIYAKGTPHHVKGCLIYNKVLQEKGLSRKYSLIGDGDKIKTVILKEPNPFHSPVLSFPRRLPVELGVDKWIDREEQFLKTFVDPLKPVLKVINWEHERRNTLF